MCVCVCQKVCLFICFLFPTAYLTKGTPILLWFFYVNVITYMIIMKFHGNGEKHFCLSYCCGRVCARGRKFLERHFGISETLWRAMELTNSWKRLKGAVMHFSRDHADCGVGLCWVLCVRSDRPLEKKENRTLGTFNLKYIWRRDWCHERMALGTSGNI